MFASSSWAADGDLYEMPHTIQCEFPEANNEIKILLRNKERSLDYVQMNRNRTIWSHSYIANAANYVQFQNNTTRTRIVMYNVANQTDDLLISIFMASLHLGRREISGYCIAIMKH